MKIFLDDVREAPAGWTLMHKIEEVQAALLAGPVEALSLDHDLGYQMDDPDDAPKYMKTGYDLCLWMAEQKRWPLTPPVIHSMNPVGRRNMQSVIDRYFFSQDEPF